MAPDYSNDLSARTVGEVMDDNNIEAQVEEDIVASDPIFKDARIRVISHSGKVLIVGQVPEQRLIPIATQIAQKVRKVTSVHNELTVGPKLSAAIKANDSWQAIKVKSRMFTTDNFPSKNINIIVENGIVYLMGRVSKDIAQRAGQIASEVGGVQKVVLLFEEPSKL
ncbi:putative periplasmic or secreted lipoprotein [Gynuella sunshinyii YC6258]|uniref:Putative periplasmic or secreted lipoprotein n=1 Tax=Gynuella sunshinyii YC6258 TaxID=1445510 RepID=A0A0C5VJF1_9GAMM|nr:putative periplasmic or secreted lipoprotein [Gynuella sunshinyii YC6258]